MQVVRGNCVADILDVFTWADEGRRERVGVMEVNCSNCCVTYFILLTFFSW